ncbi:MAG: CoA ester lyase [Rhodospirillaceae bacterium]|nr:MAG: CoA ester lyase [Rhodospirillaceae bacterium]
MMRSWLFVPAANAAMLAKAHGRGADALIIDLEDSVAEPAKPAARVNAAEFLRAHAGVRTPQLWVRINPLSTPHALMDLSAVVSARPDGIVLPKPDSAAHVAELGHYLAALESSAGLEIGAIRILPIATETPAAVFSLGTYATPVHPRLAGLTWGAEDLPAALGASINRTDTGQFTDICRLGRALCLAGAAAAGVPAIETVYPAFQDIDGLRAYAALGRREGFAGMMAIHPAQVPIINAVFTPTETEVEHARRVVALFAANPGVGTIALDGKMVDAPHLKQAQRLLEIFDTASSFATR